MLHGVWQVFYLLIVPGFIAAHVARGRLLHYMRNDWNAPGLFGIAGCIIASGLMIYFIAGVWQVFLMGLFTSALTIACSAVQFYHLHRKIRTISDQLLETLFTFFRAIAYVCLALVMDHFGFEWWPFIIVAISLPMVYEVIGRLLSSDDNRQSEVIFGTLVGVAFCLSAWLAQ